MTRLTLCTVALLTAALPTARAQSPAPIVAKDAQVLGFTMHYLEAGSGAPVVFLHGTGGEGARWMPQITELSKQFRVIAIDQIGFGASDKPMTQYHTGVFAGFVAGLLKNIGVPQASFVGQSMGANVVMYLAVHYPALVERMVLVNGGGFTPAAGAPARTGAPDWHARQIANAATLEESREYLELMYFDDRTFVTDTAVEENLTLRLKSAYTITSMSLAGEKQLGGISEAAVRALRLPTLLVWGGNDTQSTLASQDRLHAAIAGSKKIVIDKAGHYPFLEHPAQFNQAVRAFVTDTRATSTR